MKVQTLFTENEKPKYLFCQSGSEMHQEEILNAECFSHVGGGENPRHACSLHWLQSQK